MFEKAQLAAGQKILIHGASGGVGSFAVQFAKWKGAQVIGNDLSVGSAQVLTAIVVASLLSVVDPPVAVLGALLVGLVIGLFFRI